VDKQTNKNINFDDNITLVERMRAMNEADRSPTRIDGKINERGIDNIK